MSLMAGVASGTRSPNWGGESEQWWNVGKPDGPMPIWTQYGFPDEASYNAVYGPPPAPAPPAPAPAPPAPPAAPPAPPPTPTFADYINANPGQRDAWIYLEALLTEYGLGTLTQWAQNQVIQGRSGNEVQYELRQTTEFKTRFAVIEDRQKAGLSALSPAEVIAYEKQATQVMRRAGLPEGFWDQPEDFRKLQANDVSLAELDRRINDGFAMAQQADPMVRQELNRIYGIDDAHLAAFFLDPDRTEQIVMNNFGAAQRAAQAQRTGFGKLTRSEAESLIQRGVTDPQAAEGFSQLAQQRELFGSLPGENVENISRKTQLDAVFGQNANATQRIERRARQRVAEFGGSTAFTTDREGRTGIGTAR